MTGNLKKKIDENGWTWTFRDKNQSLRPIPNPFYKDVEKVASSFYVTNFPLSLDAKGLWKVFAPYGRLVDAFIANKKSKLGKRFGFVRFMGISNGDDFVRSLSNIWIGNFHVFAAVARFQRQGRGETKMNQQVRLNQHTSIRSEHGHSHNRNANVTDFPPMKQSYVSVVHGSEKTKGDSTSPVQSLKLEEQDLIKIDETDKLVLAKLKDVDTLSNMYGLCRNEGYVDLKIHHVGGLWVWILFPSTKSCSSFKDNVYMKQFCSSIKNVSPSFKVDQRMIWVEINGLPLCAWGSNAFKKVASLFGKFMFFEVDQSAAMSQGRICILTNRHHFLSEMVNIEVNDEIFDVHVHELGSWSINIIDDLSSTHSDMETKGSDCDKSTHSDDEGFMETNGSDRNKSTHSDDEDFMETNGSDSNKVDDEAFMENNDSDSNKVESECALEDTVQNIDVEQGRDENSKVQDVGKCKGVDDQCIEKPGSDYCNNDSNQEGDTSDLSRPPGFENFKSQKGNQTSGSSRTSKCSTSFAHYRKKDIRGVSLIHEMSRMIELGGTLGFDVKGCRKSLQRLIDGIGVNMFLGVQESKMTHLELFRLKTMWGNYSFDFACSMARGRSGGLISMWDPNAFIKERIWCDESYIIVKGRWTNSVGLCYMVNIYGPQDNEAKRNLWAKLLEFRRNHQGKFILFGDMNAVRDESERSGLLDLPLGGRLFTWTNKVGTKLSKLDRFLISEDVVDVMADIRVTVLDKLWSDHNPILLHCLKTDFGPSPFKLFHSWFLRDGFDDFIKTELENISHNGVSEKGLHIKLKELKQKIKQWNFHYNQSQGHRKQEMVRRLKHVDDLIDSGQASNEEREEPATVTRKS
ncbi:RNA-directed DNA polymerase, eukaryota [Artemisia annua]|uniref:RNA-directed DNA polymerase, eukaryota n=1 Tax=Artemisia annua TaxID=35608 RepID=A0A2U1LUZ9_ARTAN|nr:RNA-directed DNA polymerase, eukaryota [Artemisia annua]